MVPHDVMQHVTGLPHDNVPPGAVWQGLAACTWAELCAPGGVQQASYSMPTAAAPSVTSISATTLGSFQAQPKAAACWQRSSAPVPATTPCFQPPAAVLVQRNNSTPLSAASTITSWATNQQPLSQQNEASTWQPSQRIASARCSAPAATTGAVPPGSACATAGAAGTPPHSAAQRRYIGPNGDGTGVMTVWEPAAPRCFRSIACFVTEQQDLCHHKREHSPVVLAGSKKQHVAHVMIRPSPQFSGVFTTGAPPEQQQTPGLLPLSAKFEQGSGVLSQSASNPLLSRSAIANPSAQSHALANGPLTSTGGLSGGSATSSFSLSGLRPTEAGTACYSRDTHQNTMPRTAQGKFVACTAISAPSHVLTTSAGPTAPWEGFIERTDHERHTAVSAVHLHQEEAVTSTQHAPQQPLPLGTSRPPAACGSDSSTCSSAHCPPASAGSAGQPVEAVPDMLCGPQPALHLVGKQKPPLRTLLSDWGLPQGVQQVPCLLSPMYCALPIPSLPVLICLFTSLSCDATFVC